MPLPELDGQDGVFERRVFEFRVLVAYQAVLAGLEAAEIRFPWNRGDALRSHDEQDAAAAIVSLDLYHEQHYDRRLAARGDVVRAARPSRPIPRPPCVADPTVLRVHELQAGDRAADVPENAGRLPPTRPRA